MTALTKKQEVPYKDGKLNDFGVAASQTIYAGALVVVNSSGYLANAVAGVGGANTFAGIAECGTLSDSATNGARHIDVFTDGEFLFPVTSAAITSIGKPVYVTDNATLQLTPNGKAIGYVANYTGETNKAWIKFYMPLFKNASATFKLCVPFTHTSGGATTEVDTGVELPARALVENVFLEVVTNAASSTLDVGVIDVDSDGLLDGASCATAANVGPLNGQTADSANTGGLLMWTAGIQTGTPYTRFPKPYVVAAAKNVAYTPSDHTIAGNIHITYRLV